MMNQTDKEYMNLLEGLKDVPQDDMSREEAEAYLSAQGYDVEEVCSSIMKSTKATLLKHTWEYKAEENLRALSASDKTSSWSKKTPKEIKAAFEARQQDPDFAMAARNMKSIGVEEMRAMLEDFDELEG
jgi:hypothetical protein